MSCNVCGHQLPKSDLWLRNFDQDLRKLGKHYDAHLMEDGGIPVHGYRCRWVSLNKLQTTAFFVHVGNKI